MGCRVGAEESEEAVDGHWVDKLSGHSGVVLIVVERILEYI